MPIHKQQQTEKVSKMTREKLEKKIEENRGNDFLFMMNLIKKTGEFRIDWNDLNDKKE